MLRLLSLCTIAKQKSSHLILGTSMVSCSHMFFKINLKNTKTCRVNLTGLHNADKILGSNKTPQERLRNEEDKISNALEK